MRISQVLCKYRPAFIGQVPKFRGSALKGKHRFVPPATRATRFMMWDEWSKQEEVMKYISKPYITSEEELEYLESQGLKHQDVDALYTSHLEAPMRQRYAVEILKIFERSRKQEIWE